MISRIAASATEATTITIPTGYIVGDAIFIFAFRDGSAINPTLPAGWSLITQTLDGTSCSATCGIRIAQTLGETSGTWTNATDLVCVIYRGISQSNPNALTRVIGSNGTTNTVTYGAAQLATPGQGGHEWFLAFAGHRSADTTLETAPSGMTLIANSNIVGSSSEACAFDTNSVATADWPSTNVTITGTASGWVTLVVNPTAAPLNINNYMFGTNTPNTSGSNPGILAFGERVK